MLVRQLAISGLLSAFLATAVFGARWDLGKNQVEVEYGEVQKLVIGDGERRTWYWEDATGVTFRPDAYMKDAQDSPHLSVGKTAGGTRRWAVIFNFDKAIGRFRFQTPACSRIDLGQGDFVVQYLTDTDEQVRELWRYGTDSPGYAKDKDIAPQQLDWVTFDADQRVRRLVLRFVMEDEGFVGDIRFHADKDDGGVLEFEAAVLPLAETAHMKLLPDRVAEARIYEVSLPPRILLELGPKPPVDLQPKLLVYDRGRDRIAGQCAIAQLGWKFACDLPLLPAGAYELRLDLPGVTDEPIVGPRFALVHPARSLTWEQTHQSPFGIVGISPQIAKVMGVHQVRGGSATWVSACNDGRGIYKWGADPQAKAEQGFQYGLVYRHALHFTPHWAVDQSNPYLKEFGGWPGVYPPDPKYLPDYAEFCRRTAERGLGLYAQDYEIWNEPNAPPYGAFKGTVEEFARICHTAADAVLEVNPDARMTLGTTGGTDVGFIIRLLKAGLSEKYRIIDIHPYRHTDEGPEDGLLVDIRRLRKAIGEHGNNQAIIFSEIGWPTHVGDHPSYEPVTRFQQACYFARTMLISVAAGVERVHFHILRDWGPDPAHPEHNFGFITRENEPKMSVNGLSTIGRHLEQTKFLGVVPGHPEFHHVWAWQTPWIKDAALLTVWCDTPMVKGEVQWVDLPAKPIASEDLWGGPVDDQRVRRTETGWQALPGEDPLFVYVPLDSLGDVEPLPTAMRPWHLRRLSASHVGEGQIDIDGDVSEWADWPGAIGPEGGFDPTAAASAQADGPIHRFAIGCSKRGLFVGTRVTDSTPMQNDDSGWYVWKGDCVRLYMSSVDCQKVPWMSDDHRQLIFAPVTNGDGPPQAVHISVRPAHNGDKAGDLITGARVAAQPIQGGWSLEAFVPWEYFGRAPRAGETWGFDIGAGTNVWNGGNDNHYNPLRWGQITFASAAE